MKRAVLDKAVKPRILVVEDEGIFSADLQATLSDMGYEIASSASSGEEAVDLAGSEKPDLVLMDIMLGGDMDGIEAAEMIRERFSIPVIYITAYADDRILERAKVTEPFGYIVKPVEDRELQIAIEMALYRHKMEMERQRLTHALEKALAEVRTLSGLLPICAWCKKIRDDKGYWDDVEGYIAKHSEATFTHGICPDCLRKLEKEEEKTGE